MLTIYIRILFAAELGNYIQEVCAVALWKRTHYHLVYGIIVDFKTLPCIASAEATICLCFTEGALLDRRTTLDNLFGGMKFENTRRRIPYISSGGAELVKSRVGVMRSFGGSWKPAFSRAKISERVRLVLMMPHIGVGRRRDALIIGDDYCSPLLCARMINETRLPWCIGYAGNMPKRDIYFSFLHCGDTMETKSCRHLNLLYRQRTLLNDNR